MSALIVRIVVAACVLGFAAGSGAYAATGHVVDPEGDPIEDARACFVLEKRDLTMCARTDERGYYELPPSHAMKIEILARGFLPVTIAAVDQDAPVSLHRAAKLRVTVVDARTGDPIDASEVALFYPTGAGKGPVAVGAAGAILGTLPPGEVIVVARAIGYLEGRNAGIKLEGGVERETILKLEPAPPSAASPEQSEQPAQPEHSEP